LFTGKLSFLVELNKRGVAVYPKKWAANEPKLASLALHVTEVLYLKK